MKHFIFFFTVFIKCSFCSFSLYAQASPSLSEEQKRKIDAVFGSLLNKQYPDLDMTEATRALLIEPTIKNAEAYYDVLIYTENMNVLDSMGVDAGTELKTGKNMALIVVTARISLVQLIGLAKLSAVKAIRAAKIVKPNNKEAVGETGADILHHGFLNNTKYKGEGVIVGILDTGIDWTHDDFKNSDDLTKSRILNIWDMTLEEQGVEKTPAERNPIFENCCNYGVEYTQADINDELDGNPPGLVRTRDIAGHGTHVAGTAAGNGASTTDRRYAGMAPEADILIVRAGVAGFSDLNIINGLEYFKKKAQELNKPIVVNMSLGGHFSAHDNTDPIAIAANNFPGGGRAVVISAGNEGDDRIHVQKTIPEGGFQNTDFLISPYIPALGPQNDLALFLFYMNGKDPVRVTVTSPGGTAFSLEAEEEKDLASADGYIYGQNDVDPNNGERFVQLQIFDANSNTPPASGNWTIRFNNPPGGDEGTLEIHGWMYNASLPVVLAEGNNEYTIASPGTAPNAITTGAYAHRLNFSTAEYESLGSPGINGDIAPFSSRGPTRAGIQKPDITAPGQWIVSSKSGDASVPFVAPGGKHYFNLGTSMAAPVVTGAAALLFQQNPQLTGEQIKTLIKNNAMKDVHTGPADNNTWGAGKSDVFKAMSKLLNSNVPTDREIVTYDEGNNEVNIPLSGTQKAAVRFTPDFTGYITGAFFHIYGTQEAVPLNLTGPLMVQIHADDDGEPGEVLAVKSYSQSMVFKYTWHFISFAEQPVPVVAGQDFHVVVFPSNPEDDWGLNAENGSVDLRSYVSAGGARTLQNTFDFRIRSVVSSSGVIPSPITETLRLSGERAERAVILKWTTAAETNTDRFEVERKFSDEREFRKIGELNAKGGQNLKTAYNYNDPAVASNTSPFIYYRLKSVDNGSNDTYSDIVTIANPLHDFLEGIYPNPAHDVVYVVTKEDTEKKVQVIDRTGKAVLERSLSGKLGTLDINTLAPGQYFIKVNGGTSFKLIKN